MRPTILSLVVYVCLIVLPSLWCARSEGTITTDDHSGCVWRNSFGPGRLVTITTRENGSGGTSSVDVSWVGIGVFLVACYPPARLTAWFVERAAGNTLSPTRWILAGAGLILVLALVLAIGMSKYYWGYFFQRPPASAAVEGIREVTTLSFVRCSVSSGRARCALRSDHSLSEELQECRKDQYYCLEGRIAVGLRESGRLPANPTPTQPAVLRQVESVLTGQNVLVPSESGYDGNADLTGIVVTDENGNRGSVLAIAITGREVSNDHYPHYELLVDAGGDKVRIIRKTVFFYDVAGMEGVEWLYMFIAAGVLGLSGLLPLGIMAAVFVGARRRGALHLSP